MQSRLAPKIAYQRLTMIVKRKIRMNSCNENAVKQMVFHRSNSIVCAVQISHYTIATDLYNTNNISPRIFSSSYPITAVTTMTGHEGNENPWRDVVCYRKRPENETWLPNTRCLETVPACKQGLHKLLLDLLRKYITAIPDGKQNTAFMVGNRRGNFCSKEQNQGFRCPNREKVLTLANHDAV